MDHFASGLEQEGLTPPNPDGMKLLALYSRNRPEWIIAEQVCEQGLWMLVLRSVGVQIFRLHGVQHYYMHARNAGYNRMVSPRCKNQQCDGDAWPLQTSRPMKA